MCLFKERGNPTCKGAKNIINIFQGLTGYVVPWEKKKKKKSLSFENVNFNLKAVVNRVFYKTGSARNPENEEKQ